MTIKNNIEMTFICPILLHLYYSVLFSAMYFLIMISRCSWGPSGGMGGGIRAAPGQDPEPLMTQEEIHIDTTTMERLENVM